MSIDHLDHKAQPRVNREWYEKTKEITEEKGTCASEAMRKGANLITDSLESGVIPECYLGVNLEGKIIVTPVSKKEHN